MLAGMNASLTAYKTLLYTHSAAINSGKSPLYMPCKDGQLDSGCAAELKCATGFNDDEAEAKKDLNGNCVAASVCGATYKGSAGTVECNAINMVMTAVSALALLTQM